MAAFRGDVGVIAFRIDGFNRLQNRAGRFHRKARHNRLTARDTT
jgi:hypothetical protein